MSLQHPRTRFLNVVASSFCLFNHIPTNTLRYESQVWKCPILSTSLPRRTHRISSLVTPLGVVLRGVKGTRGLVVTRGVVVTRGMVGRASPRTHVASPSTALTPGTKWNDVVCTLS